MSKWLRWWNTTTHLRKELKLIIIFYNIFQKMEADSLYEASIFLISKSGNDKTIQEGNIIKPIVLMNIDAKPLTEISKSNPKRIKIIIQHNQVGLSPVMQGCFNI